MNCNSSEGLTFFKLKSVHIMLTLGDYHAALQVLAGIEEMSGAAAIFARLVSNMRILNSHTGNFLEKFLSHFFQEKLALARLSLSNSSLSRFMYTTPNT